MNVCPFSLYLQTSNGKELKGQREKYCSFEYLKPHKVDEAGFDEVMDFLFKRTTCRVELTRKTIFEKNGQKRPAGAWRQAREPTRGTCRHVRRRQGLPPRQQVAALELPNTRRGQLLRRNLDGLVGPAATPCGGTSPAGALLALCSTRC